MKQHDDVFVEVIDLPVNIHGFSHLNIDGTYTVILNANDASSIQKDTLHHEIEHIESGDYDNLRLSVDTLEKERHRR